MISLPPTLSHDFGWRSGKRVQLSFAFTHCQSLSPATPSPAPTYMKTLVKPSFAALDTLCLLRYLRLLLYLRLPLF